MPDVEPEVELLPDFEVDDVLAFVPVLPLEAFAVVEPEPVVDDLLLLPVEDEEEETGKLELDELEPELNLVPDLELDPELPVLPLIPVLLLIDDEPEDPDVLPDMLPEL